MGIVVFFLAATAWGQTILFENFNSGIPGTWTVIDSGTTNDTWHGTSGGYAGNTLDGTEFAFVDSDAAGNSVDSILIELLESPAFNTTGYSSVFLEFDHYYREISTDSGFVEVFNGTSWIPVATYSSNTGGWNSPAHPVIDLTPYRNANMKFRFRYEDNQIWAWYWAVDNVRLFVPLSIDGSVVAQNAPQTNCGLSANEAVTVQVANFGTDTLSNYTVSYRVSGATVTETGTIAIPPNDTITFTFSNGANLSAGGNYQFETWVTATSDGNAANDSLNGFQATNYPQAGALPYLEDFDAGQAGWFSGGVNSTWAFGTPAKDEIIGAASSPNAWVTGGLGTGNHLNNDQSWVVSPCMDLSAAGLPVVGLDIWWNSEFSWDGAALQASSDLGNNWVTIGAFGDPDNWYTDGTINGAPGGQQEGWSGRASSGNGSGGWVSALNQAYAMSGEAKVIFRMNFGSDGSVTDDGVAFDNFRVAEAPYLNLGNDTTICDSIVLDAGPGAGYVWSNGDSSRYVVVQTSGTWSVTVTDSLGFYATDEIVIQSSQTASLDLGQDTVLCNGESVVLYAGSTPVSWQWSTGATGSNILVTGPGQYSVEVNYGSGCTDRDTILVDYSTLDASISLATDTVCLGSPIYFQDNSGPSSTWWWNFGDGTFSGIANPVHAYFTGGTYPVRLRVSDGICTDSTVKLIFVDPCLVHAVDPAPQLVLAPNPTSGKFRVTGLETTRFEVLRLWSPDGRLLESRSPKQNPTGFWDLSPYPAGIYRLEVRMESQVLSFPVIRQ